MKDPTQKLLTVFTTVLTLPSQTDPSGIRRSAVVAWDSLVQITLISAIEEEFNVMFDADEYGTITSFERAAELLKKRGLL